MKELPKAFTSRWEYDVNDDKKLVKKRLEGMFDINTVDLDPNVAS